MSDESAVLAGPQIVRENGPTEEPSDGGDRIYVASQWRLMWWRFKKHRLAVASTAVLLNFNALFGFVVQLTTQYSQPLLGFMFCVYAGWVWRRDEILRELRKGNAGAEHSLFWKVWPWYVRIVCPVIILAIFAQTFV